MVHAERNRSFSRESPRNEDHGALRYPSTVWGRATVETVGQAGGEHGRVVILNGGSSAGKTTLARALQAAMPAPWLLFGIDLMIWTMPPAMVNHPDGLTVRQGMIIRGDPFLLLYEGFRKGVGAIARNGVDLLVDDVTLDAVVDQERWDDALQELQVCWVGVHCSPDIATEREAGRGSRLPGIARRQAESVHAGLRYDVEVDSGHLGVTEEIDVIADWLRRTWSIEVVPDREARPTLPVTPAWTSGQELRPAPWER